MFVYKATMLGMINQMNQLNKRSATLMERLSTGQRINRAADDPAGLAISEKMRGQIRGLRQAQRNVMDGISLIQTAEGGMNEVHDILQRMRELSVQAANGTYNDEDRQKLNEEFLQLKEAINDISQGTEYNTQKLLDGSKESDGITLQVGPNAGNTMDIHIGKLSSEGLGLSTIDLSTQQNAEEAMDYLDKAIRKTSSQRASLGAMQNRLEHTLNYLENYEMNLTEAESRIRDADMAETIMEYTKTQILAQVTQAMFAQAMKLERERVLQLLESLN